ncbi:MAG: DUF2183 domain-containing protein [Bacteroidia bacterium]|nr:DUF2183 domain-containing protein [Bacteroidia bacterium]
MFRKDPLQIICFKTYGTKNHLYMRGRAIEDEDIDLKHKSWFNILRNSWKRFETDEIKDVSLTLSIDHEHTYALKTDLEGYYLLDETAAFKITDLDDEGWLHYAISFANKLMHEPIQHNNSFYGKMLVPAQNVSFGVISDIDDTILHTGVTSRLKWKVVVNTFFKTPEKRLALEGSSEFYRSLHLGNSRKEANPIFYVSNSPWNLYRYLEYFLTSNDFPDGPILLRDFRTPFDRTPKSEVEHKYHEISNILKSYPHLNFILIGDCGERDADIYLEIVNDFPNRISAIYLRSVEHQRKMRRIEQMFKDFNEIPVLIIKDTETGSHHAKTLGFIS